MSAFLLLVLFQIKHFLCDYPLQTPYHLGKFKEKGWVLPLIDHASTHAVFTFFICGAYLTLNGLDFLISVIFSILFMILDLLIHFSMDAVKCRPALLGRFKYVSDKKFWWSLGLDQMVHHLTHYLIIYFILKLIQYSLPGSLLKLITRDFSLL